LASPDNRERGYGNGNRGRNGGKRNSKTGRAIPDFSQVFSDLSRIVFGTSEIPMNRELTERLDYITSIDRTSGCANTIGEWIEKGKSQQELPHGRKLEAECVGERSTFTRESPVRTLRYGSFNGWEKYLSWNCRYRHGLRHQSKWKGTSF
jgi:hypothetical protein